MLEIRSAMSFAHAPLNQKCTGCKSDFDHTPFVWDGMSFCSAGCANDFKRHYGG